VGRVARFPREIEEGIDEYLAMQDVLEAVPAEPTPVRTGGPSALAPVAPPATGSASIDLAGGVVLREQS
jgi:hypothetical protein